MQNNVMVENLNKLVVDRIKTFIGNEPLKLNKLLSQQIYEIIFNVFVEIFTESKQQISNEAMNFISQMYYDNLTLNGRDDLLDPNIFEKRAQLEHIQTRDLAVLAMLFKSTLFAAPFVMEIKRRS